MKFKEELKKLIFMARKTGRQKAQHVPLSLRFDVREPAVWDDFMVDEYRFVAELGQQICCRGEDLEHMKRLVYETMMNHIYGDLTRLVQELDLQIHCNNMEETRKILEKIYREVMP